MTSILADLVLRPDAAEKKEEVCRLASALIGRRRRQGEIESGGPLMRWAGRAKQS